MDNPLGTGPVWRRWLRTRRPIFWAERVPSKAGRWGPPWLAVVVLATWIIYYWFGSAGGNASWPVWGSYLDLQAEGFRAGHTYVPIAPPPELINAADPYDRVNIRYWALDLSYYRGRYYTYWGPVPALFQALIKALMGIDRVIGDQYIGFVSACLTSLVGAVLIERCGRRLFDGISRSALCFCILAFACANPILHNVATAGVYQSAILASQAWLMAGLLVAFEVVWHAGTNNARRWRLLLCGLCWGLALGSRVTVGLPIAALIAVTALASGWTYRRRWLSALSAALWLGLPVLATGLGLLAYNKVRFDDYLEFGLNLQLSGYPRLHFEREYWLPNLYAYSLRPWVQSCQFPWLYQVWWMKEGAFPDWFPLPAGYMVDEPVVGWLRAVPLTWLLPFALLGLPRLAELRDRSRPAELRDRRSRAHLWCLVAFGACASLSGLTAMGVYGATMRYLSDVTPGLVLFAALGAMTLGSHRYALLAPRLVAAVIASLSMATMLLGLLFGYQGYGGQFHKNNPTLDASLVKLLSVCGKSKPEVPRYMPW